VFSEKDGPEPAAQEVGGWAVEGSRPSGGKKKTSCRRGDRQAPKGPCADQFLTTKTPALPSTTGKERATSGGARKCLLLSLSVLRKRKTSPPPIHVEQIRPPGEGPDKKGPHQPAPAEDLSGKTPKVFPSRKQKALKSNQGPLGEGARECTLAGKVKSVYGYAADQHFIEEKTRAVGKRGERGRCR